MLFLFENTLSILHHHLFTDRLQGLQEIQRPLSGADNRGMAEGESAGVHS